MSKNNKYGSNDCFNSKIHRRDTFIHRGCFLNKILSLQMINIYTFKNIN